MLRTMFGAALGLALLAGCGAQAIQPGPTSAPWPTARPCLAQIKTLRLSDMSVSAITAPDQPAADPAWSPDGRTLAVIAERAGNQDIFLIDAVGGDLRQLTADPAADRAPDWSPDGRSLVFASDRGGASQLYAIGADGAGEAHLPTAQHSAHDPAWSPDGRSILYASDEPETSNRVVRMVAADAAQDRLILNVANPLGYHGQDYELPVWSPDGRRFLAVYEFRGGLWSDLKVWASPESPEPAAAIYSGGSAVAGADWSPDGERVVFARDGVLVIAPAIAGGADSAIDTGVAGYNPSWSPDGAYIAFDTGCQP
ncbi:MAG TPA: hypothetical protein VD886_06915 [Herpetosiphonaceae bacterium]|nr:hypothetical protein [Herpetosiphonaceae bacterium]